MSPEEQSATIIGLSEQKSPENSLEAHLDTDVGQSDSSSNDVDAGDGPTTGEMLSELKRVLSGQRIELSLQEKIMANAWANIDRQPIHNFSFFVSGEGGVLDAVAQRESLRAEVEGQLASGEYYYDGPQEEHFNSFFDNPQSWQAKIPGYIKRKEEEEEEESDEKCSHGGNEVGGGDVVTKTTTPIVEELNSQLAWSRRRLMSRRSGRSAADISSSKHRDVTKRGPGRTHAEPVELDSLTRALLREAMRRLRNRRSRHQQQTDLARKLERAIMATPPLPRASDDEDPNQLLRRADTRAVLLRLPVEAGDSFDDATNPEVASGTLEMAPEVRATPAAALPESQLGSTDELFGDAGGQMETARERLSDEVFETALIIPEIPPERLNALQCDVQALVCFVARENSRARLWLATEAVENAERELVERVALAGSLAKPALPQPRHLPESLVSRSSELQAMRVTPTSRLYKRDQSNYILEVLPAQPEGAQEKKNNNYEQQLSAEFYRPAGFYPASIDTDPGLDELVSSGTLERYRKVSDGSDEPDSLAFSENSSSRDGSRFFTDSSAGDHSNPPDTSSQLPGVTGGAKRLTRRVPAELGAEGSTTLAGTRPPADREISSGDFDEPDPKSS